MSVIINELEIVVEQPVPAGATVGSTAPAASPLQPPDIAGMDDRRARARARLAAH